MTGASGFLGRAIVAAARRRGHEVAALSRRGGGGTVACDLGLSGAAEALTDYLRDADAIVHAAASLEGAAAQRRDTVAATRAVAASAEAAGVGRFVLISSFSVYDVAGLRDGAILAEDTALVSLSTAPDAYAAAKRTQETMFDGAGPIATGDGPRGVETVILRPGAIYGPGRLWSVQVGFRRGRIALCPAPEGRVPAIHVDRCAEAVARACEGAGVPIVNLVDPDPPRRAEWARALGLSPVGLPLGPVLAAAAPLGRRRRFAARFRPLRYDDARMRTLMADAVPPRPFVETIAADLRRDVGGGLES